MDENMKGAGGVPEETGPSVSAAAEGGTTSQLSAEGGGSPVHDSGADTSVRVPKRGRAYDRSGSRVGKVRRGVWYDEDGKRLGEFVKEGDGVLYKDGGRSLGYVDANRNVFTHAGEYLATIRTAKVPLLFFLLLVLLFLALLTGVICSYFIGRSHEDAIPVIRIADTQGNDWAYTEDLPIFYNDYFKYTYGQGYNTGSDYMTALGNTTSDLRYLTGTEFTDRRMAWYLNADYGFLNKYFLNFGMSMETSSRFGNDAGGLGLCGVSWGCFPSVSGAWLISSENFMRDLDFVNSLKLRVAYTMSGNDRLPVFATRTYFTSGQVANDATGLVLANIGNEQLKWETTGRANVGLDFSILSNRLSMNIDWFYSRTKDLVTLRSLNEEAGLQYYYDNGGEMENRGFEIGANARVVDTKDFKFNVGLTVGHYKNEVTSLPNGSFTTEVCGGTVLTEVGQPAGVFYGYRTDGVYSTAKEASDAGLAILSSSGQRIPFSAGDMRFVDVHADGVIDEKDRVVIGDPNPDIYGNFNLNFRWRDLELGALFTYSLGNDAYNALRADLESGSSLSNQSVAMENRWMADGQVTDIPRVTYEDPMGNARFSDRWIEDASYLKFKRLMLSYHVPLRSTSFLQGVSVWAAVNNLCTLTKYLGPDPEFSYGQSVLYQGVDAGLTPQSRSFQIGVKLSL